MPIVYSCGTCNTIHPSLRDIRICPLCGKHTVCSVCINRTYEFFRANGFGSTGDQFKNDAKLVENALKLSGCRGALEDICYSCTTNLVDLLIEEERRKIADITRIVNLLKGK